MAAVLPAADQPIPVALFPALPPDPIAAPAAVVNIQNTVAALQNANIPSLETDSYNRQLVEDVIQRNLYDQNIFNPPLSFNIQHHQGDVRDPAKLQKDLEALFETGLRIALPSDDPGQAARQAIGTLAEGAYDMNQQGLLFDAQAVHNAVVGAVNAEIGAQTLTNLHYEQMLPPAAITGHFDAAGQHLLQKPNLTVTEMNQISDRYKTIIANAQASAAAQNIGERRTSNLLRQFSKWADDHVENDQLKAILKNDARRVSGQRLSDLGFRASNLQPEIVPLTASKGLEIESSAARDELAAIPGLVTTHVDNVGNVNQAATNLVGIIDELNRHAKLHRMRFQAPATQGVVPPPEIINIKVRNPDNTVKTVNELKAELKVVTDNFINPRVTVVRHATREAELTGISENDFIRDLQQATKNISRDSNRRRVRKSTMPKPHSIKKIGAILIRGDATNKKEIHIKANAKKEDLMKLVYLLLAEDGTLDDTSHNHILKIKKGMPAAAVYQALMDEFNKNLGADTILTYHSDSPVGGQFLDGFMSEFNHRPLIPIAPSLHGGNLSLGALTSSGFIHTDPRQAFLNMPLHSFTPFKPAVIGRFGRMVQPIPLLAGSVANVSRIPIGVF